MISFFAFVLQTLLSVICNHTEILTPWSNSLGVSFSLNVIFFTITLCPDELKSLKSVWCAENLQIVRSSSSVLFVSYLWYIPMYALTNPIVTMPNRPSSINFSFLQRFLPIGTSPLPSVSQCGKWEDEFLLWFRFETKCGGVYRSESAIKTNGGVVSQVPDLYTNVSHMSSCDDASENSSNSPPPPPP